MKKSDNIELFKQQMSANQAEEMFGRTMHDAIAKVADLRLSASYDTMCNGITCQARNKRLTFLEQARRWSDRDQVADDFDCCEEVAEELLDQFDRLAMKKMDQSIHFKTKNASELKNGSQGSSNKLHNNSGNKVSPPLLSNNSFNNRSSNSFLPARRVSNDVGDSSPNSNASISGNNDLLTPFSLAANAAAVASMSENGVQIHSLSVSEDSSITGSTLRQSLIQESPLSSGDLTAFSSVTSSGSTSGRQRRSSCGRYTLQLFTVPSADMMSNSAHATPLSSSSKNSFRRSMDM